MCRAARKTMRSILANDRRVLARLPAFGIAPAVEAGNYHHAVLLNVEEYSVRKTPHSRTPPFPDQSGVANLRLKTLELIELQNT